MDQNVQFEHGIMVRCICLITVITYYLVFIHEIAWKTHGDSCSSSRANPVV